ncbi:MAG: xanthine dehydrogenase family protein molybdopterin-binding subunit [Pseudomonadales bacterium]|nr:xanthine dehydrogenase family protein molybdopterin-binding subunit [Pseudomonadales bacterium]
MTRVTRRRFIQSSATAAGGLMLAFHVPAFGKAKPFDAATGGSEINAWILIDPDDTITIRVAQSEMGEGVMTSLPMIVADELEADFKNVRAEYADANRSVREGGVYNRMLTGGSSAVRHSRPYLQQAGAEARERLVKAAAERWNVAPAECYADYGKVYHRPTRRSINYGAVAADAAKVSVAGVKIKSPRDFDLIGLPTPRLDVPEKVDGSAVFGMDVRLPGMVYAAVVHCPVLSGTLRGFRFNAVRDKPGVIAAVRLERGVAIVAETFWQAKTAAEALPIEWDIGEDGRAFSDSMQRDFVAALDKEGALVDNQGKAAETMDLADKVIESQYVVPYLSHACMEPLNCTVQVSPGRIDVWAGVQDPLSALKAAAETAGVAPENVYVHNCFLGGGFGRRSHPDYVREAVQVAMEVGQPVQMIWTREEDSRQGQYRPMAAIRFKAGFDISKNLIAYTNHSVTHSILSGINPDAVKNGVDPTSVEGLSNMPYRVANKRITHTIKNTYLSAWFWRSVGSSQNAFALECFVDEMATAAGMDPLHFRKRYLADRPEMLNVLDQLAQKSGWGKRMAYGSAQGMAIHECFGTICAQVAEVTVTEKGGLTVDRIVSVVDCGNLVNPMTAEEQIESGIVFGLTAALYGKLTIENGRVLETNFDTYRMLTMAETPVIETHFALSGGDKWGGIGEPGTPPVAPAVCNALYRITGRRIRSLPIKDYYLSRA